MHVARSSQRIRRDRPQRPVRRLVGGRAARLHQRTAGSRLVAAVGDQRHVAQPRVQRQRSVLELQQERRAAAAVVVGDLRPDAEVLAERQPGERVLRLGDEEGVDVARREACVGERPQARMGRQLDGFEAGRLADSESGRADDRCLAARKSVHRVLLRLDRRRRAARRSRSRCGPVPACRFSRRQPRHRPPGSSCADPRRG